MVGLRASHLPPVSLGFHSVGDFNEAGNIGAREQAGKDIVGELFARPLASCSQANLRPPLRFVFEILYQRMRKTHSVGLSHDSL